MRYFSLKAARKTVLASLSLISPFSLAPMALASEAGQAPVEAAAEAYDGQNEIVVTARRRAETAQNVPVAISVVGAQDLEKTGNYSLAQIQQLVPSLQITSANPRNTNINIRGLGANSSIAVDGLEYGVGFYLDGVYYGRPGQSQFDLVDLQQIEVLHGPQGTLFGKNTTSGAINATSKAPSFVPEVTAEISGGTYDYHQFRASVSGPIIADKLAVRLSVADTHRGGFLTNLYDGEKAHDYDNFNVRGQLLFRPVEDVSIRLIGDYANQKQAMMLNLIDGYYTHFANGTPIANNVFDRAAYAGYDLPQTNAFDRQGNSNSPYQSHMKSYGASAQVDWDLPFATLTSITAYRWWDSYPRNDVDGTPLSSHTKGHQDNFQRQFSQELRIASTGRNQIDYVAGLYYYWQKIRGYSQVQTGKDFVEWNLNPANFSAPLLASIDAGLTDLQMNSYSDPEVRSYAAFGQLDWNISPDFTITAGLRFTHEAKSGIYRRQIAPESGGDRSLLPIGMQNQFQVTDLSFGASLTDNALAGLLSANYKITPDAMIYASYSRGSKSGGLNLTPGGANNPTVNPEKVTAYEIGLKSQFLDRAVTFNAAAFLTEVRDYQANISDPIVGTTTYLQYIANIPKVRSKGVEADLIVSPAKWVSLSGSLSYTDARYVTYRNAPQRSEMTIPGTAQVQDLSGATLPGISKWAYALAADLNAPINSLNGVAYLRADYFYRSSYNSSATNSIYSAIPGYGLVNGRVGLRLNDGQLDLALWVRNLTDKKYRVSRTAGSFGLINATVGDPRTIGITLRTSF